MTTKKGPVPLFYCSPARNTPWRGPNEMGFLPKRLTSATASLLEAKGDLQPRQDSNLDQAFRKRLFYPLNYGAVVAKIERPTFCGGKDATHL